MKGRTYWRSLEGLADDPRSRAFLEREFPEGASELPQGVSRRSMLGLIGASLSLAGLTACRRPVEHIVPYVEAPEDALPGIPKRYATTMPFGLSALGVVVESHEGRPTKIEGNREHPSTHGSSNAWMQAAIYDLYDPDRSKSVRQGDTASSWDAFGTAWAALRETYAASGGAGLAVLTESYSSPSLARMAAAFRSAFPQARFVTWEPVSDENVHEGVRRATGRTLLPQYRIDRAKVLLSIDSDFLSTESESVRHAQDFARGRMVDDNGGEMNRLYVVEPGHSLTGSNADHRRRLAPGQIAAFVTALRAAVDRGLGRGASAAAAADGIDARWIDAVAADLVANRGACLVLAGRRQPPAIHAAVYALNEALGNLDLSLYYREPVDVGLPSTSALADLVGAMQSGSVETLVMLGGNPAYAAPADLDFAGAMGQVAHTVHLSHAVNETSRIAGWHLPRAHFLEAWGDARGVDGTLSVVQPLILPLFGGKSDLEMLAWMATGEAPSAHEIVRQTWASVLTGDFERAWSRVLHDGLLRSTGTLTVVAPSRPQTAAPSGAATGGMSLVFEASPSVWDGRFANIGWLQEMPDPMTKITWDNAALLGPATAAALGVANDDIVRIQRAERQIELPVWILPGLADDTIVVRLGYGRTAAGQVGNGTGASAYVLRTTDATDLARDVQVTPTGARRALAQTQDHGSMTEPDLPMRQPRTRPIVREASLEEFREHPEFAQHMVEVPHEESLWHEHSYDHGQQWGMTIDLNACTGCNACVVACQAENNIPVVGREQVANGREMQWLRIDRYFAGDPDEPETVHQPVPCMMCENAPCEQVCPVAATVHDGQGLNTMVYNRCIGTRYCSNNCPYKVRRFNFFNYTKDTPESLKLLQNPDVTVRSRGVMEKCTYCTQRINAARIDAKLDGRPFADGDVQTACQQACPSQAIRFGDIRDESSQVAASKRSPRNYALLAELYTRPRTTYLAKLRNPNPALAEG